MKLLAATVVNLWVIVSFSMDRDAYQAAIKTYRDNPSTTESLQAILAGLEASRSATSAGIIRFLGSQLKSPNNLESIKVKLHELIGDGRDSVSGRSSDGDAASVGGSDTVSVGDAKSEIDSAKTSVSTAKQSKQELLPNTRKLQGLYRSFDKNSAKNRAAVIAAEDALLTELGRDTFREQLFGILEDAKVIAAGERDLGEVDFGKIGGSPHLQRVYQMLTGRSKNKIAQDKLAYGS